MILALPVLLVGLLFELADLLVLELAIKPPLIIDKNTLPMLLVECIINDAKLRPTQKKLSNQIVIKIENG
ncbi:hypothetical protein GCM10011501_31790 [Thalassotalea profundi]|uniref:LysR substrate-binding domain-containing protein n=1 Tax=Thalassotalea profundi TaxID=2036687 RepID=A0ABQ3J0H4_9GAMM|nr:hypothetical protein GCM10011501_31790 [Thalassotalea profundi]